MGAAFSINRPETNDYYLFANLKRWLQRNKLHTNEILEVRWKKCISLQGDYIKELNYFTCENSFFHWSPQVVNQLLQQILTLC